MNKLRTSEVGTFTRKTYGRYCRSFQILLALLPLVSAQWVQADAMSGYQIPNTVVHKLSSELTGSDYEILVWLPYTYDKVAENRYPVLYILDGQWDFGNVEASIRNNFVDKRIPELILVGISFGGSAPKYLNIRSHDCLPTEKVIFDGSTRGGGAPQFLQFVKEDVIQLIESNYRVDDSYRVLGGSSYGGLFALYAMMMDSDLFDAYIALSPSLMWDSGWYLEEQKRRVETFQSIKTRLWLGVGDNENPRMFEAVEAFRAEAESYQSDDFLMEFRVVEGEGHAGMKVESYNRALRFAFGHLKDR